MSDWLDKYEKADEAGRKLAREGACEENFWIKPRANGTRILKPYHCGTCDNCLDRKAIDIQAKLQSMAGLNDLRAFVAKPAVVSKLIRAISADDYVRFPCADGFDYLFSIGGVGKSIDDTDIDFKILSRRRAGTRKSGKLILISKPKDKSDTIEIFNIRTTTREMALIALEEAETTYNLRKNNGFFEETVDDAQVLSVYNNVISMSICVSLEANSALVQQSLIKVEYELPTTFKFGYTEERYFENDKK